jgi:hypothetical protein
MVFIVAIRRLKGSEQDANVTNKVGFGISKEVLISSEVLIPQCLSNANSFKAQRTTSRSLRPASDRDGAEEVTKKTGVFHKH